MALGIPNHIVIYTLKENSINIWSHCSHLERLLKSLKYKLIVENDVTKNLIVPATMFPNMNDKSCAHDAVHCGSTPTRNRWKL